MIAHKTDHCTFFPDTIFGVCIGECCKCHDKCYDIGGFAKDRRTADRTLRECIANKEAGRIRLTVIAYIVYFGVRIGGSRWFNRVFRKNNQRFKWL